MMNGDAEDNQQINAGILLGNPVATTDPRGFTTQTDFTNYFMDDVNRYSYAFPKTVTNALNQTTTTKYEFNTSLPVLNTDLRGYTTAMTYDLMNRMTSTT